MKKPTQWAIGGFLFTSVMGTLLHFAFEWSGNHPIVGLFSAVNESIWEHMKLIFFPMVVYAIIQYRFWQGRGEDYWCEKHVSILIALVLIPLIYYTYTGILGKSVDWFNIAIFFISAGEAYRCEAIRFQKGAVCALSGKASVIVIAVIALLFVLFPFRLQRSPCLQIPERGCMAFADKGTPPVKIGGVYAAITASFC